MTESDESLTWLSACGTAACLEVAHDEGGGAYIRNNAVPGVVVGATSDEWRQFVEAVRSGMAQTGENYTRATAAVEGSPTSRVGSRTDAVKEHVERLLEVQLRAIEAFFARADELERHGHRIVTGGQTSQSRWEIKDWNTGEVLAEGDGGIEG